MKQIVEEKIDSRDFDACYIGHDDRTDIQDIIEWLVEMKEEGASHVKFEGDVFDGECEDIEIKAVKAREETDAEYYNRIQRELASSEAQRNKQEQKEKLEYERLKAKYEQNNG
jgi:hypothetical protein